MQKLRKGKLFSDSRKKLMLYQGALYHHHTPSGKLEDVLQFMVPQLTGYLPQMDVSKILDTRISNEHCACYMTGSGGQAWLCRCRRQSEAASDASSMKAVILKPQCDQSFLPHLWSCCMLPLPALRPQWRWIDPQMW